MPFPQDWNLWQEKKNIQSDFIFLSHITTSMSGGSQNNSTGAELHIHRHEQLLEAVAFSAKQLLSNRDWQNSINEILMRLGQASTSSRVYVFRHEAGEPAGHYTSLAYEWCAPGIQAQLSNPDLQHMEVSAVGFQRWIDLMSMGKTVFGAVEEFPEEEQPLLLQQDIKSLIVIPFFVSGRWWGFIGFDQCDQTRDWTTAERGALQAAASMIGSAIERQNAEDRLQQQYEELQKTNHELDSFVYSVSHDLRAPLLTILGLVNIAEKDDQPGNWPVYLQHIRSSINRLDNFIKEILEYSRNSRTDIEPEKINIRDWFHQALSSAWPPDAEIQFEEKYETTPLPVFIDRNRLLIILNNILSNAYRFRDPRKTKCQVTVNGIVNEREMLLTIEDNGIGIDTPNLSRVFEMFYRATDQSPGSGLGLYITKETVLKLKGTIRIESAIGEFTRVEIRLPVQQHNRM
jgi:signal transduction histidine kinase